MKNANLRCAVPGLAMRLVALQTRPTHRSRWYWPLLLLATAGTLLLAWRGGFGWLGQAPPPAGLELWERHVFVGSQGTALPYRLLKPAQCDPKSTYPLVLFLHGAGERGNDNQRQLLHTATLFSQEDARRRYPCFVLAPQCPRTAKWADEDAPPPPALAAPTELALELLMQGDWPIDRQRIYVVGLSMGGSATWELLWRRPYLFAAGVPICGGGDPSKVDRVANLPVWAFHGARDTVVKPDHSRRLIAVMRQAGGLPRYTEYPEADHFSWYLAAAEPDLLRWLFAQRRPDAANRNLTTH